MTRRQADRGRLPTPACVEGCQLARFRVVIPVMSAGLSASFATGVREQVAAAASGTFFSRGDFDGTEPAVDTALSRLAAAHELVRVRKGLYWKGRPTRLGMTRPSAYQVALRIGGVGSGPASVAAAHALGLTTQVPAVVEVAVPGKTPDPYPGIRFWSRPYERRERELRPLEVAVLEVLREPFVVEVSPERVEARIRELIATGVVRGALLVEEANDEARPIVRARMAEIAAVA